MDNMTNELMLLGFATLILLAFQKDIDHICSEFHFISSSSMTLNRAAYN